MRSGRIWRSLSRFCQDRSGAVMVEMLASVVLLNMCMVAFYIWWQSYNSHALVDRMTYTINDLITRQEGLVLDRSFLDGLETTAEFILDPEQNAAIRFTQVTLQPGPTPDSQPVMQVDWSYSPCGALPIDQAGPGFDVEDLPLMAVGATMIVTDVQVPFASTFDLMPSILFERRAVSLYRFEMRFDLQGTGTSACID